MKKTLMWVLFFVALVLPGHLFAQPVEVTIYCDDDYPPYAYLDQNEAKGIYTEIIRAVDKKMPEYLITIEAVPWRRGLSYMETGEGFALFPPYYRPDDRPFMDYSLEILDEELAVLVRADSEITENSPWPEAFQGKMLGINDGFLALEEWRDKGIFTVDESPNNRVAILKLVQGRIDGYVNDRLAMLSSVSEMRASGEAVPEVRVGPVLSAEIGHLGITNQGGDRFPYKDDFVAKMGMVLDEMRNSGEIQRIVEAYVK